MFCAFFPLNRPFYKWDTVFGILQMRYDVWDLPENNGGGNIGERRLAMYWLLRLGDEDMGIH